MGDSNSPGVTLELELIIININIRIYECFYSSDCFDLDIIDIVFN